MISANGRISIKQLKILIYLNLCGAGMLALPRFAAELAGSDGWLLMLLAIAAAIAYTALVTSLASMFPRDTFAVYSRKIAGKYIGVILSALFFVRITITSALLLRIFGETVRQTMLYKTPMFVTCGLIALLSAYIAVRGIETRARFAELLVYIALVPFLFIYFTAALKADILNLLPALKTPYLNMGLGAFYLSFSFRGVELLLMAYPFCAKPLAVKKAALRAVFGVGVILFLVTAVTLAKLGATDTKAQLLPVIQMIDTVKLPARFFERLDAIMLSLWIISILVSVSGGIFYSAHLASSYLFRKTESVKRHGSCGSLAAVLFSAFVITAASLVPANIKEVYEWLFLFDLTAGTAFLLVVPALLILLAKARGIRGDVYARD